jgi:hypothetical protein
MDDIIGDINKTTTECGHIFHCSCLMRNTAHNGYGCPCCRGVMAETIDDSETIDGSEDDDDDYDDDDDDDDEPYDDDVLTTFRMFHQYIENEEIEDEPIKDDDDEQIVNINIPTPEFISQRLQNIGVSFEDMVKCLLVNHIEYEDDIINNNKDNQLFGQIRIIVSNYPRLVS